MSILQWHISSSSNFASFFIVMAQNSSLNFKLTHFLLWIKGSHQNPNFETFECSGENLPNFSCHFPNHKSVFLQILRHSSVLRKITGLYFFSANIIYFGQKHALKVQSFETFECSRQNLLNCSCQFWNFMSILVKPLVRFCIILHCHAHNSSVNFKLTHFLLGIRGSHQSPNFETFECSGENLRNSSCHFPNLMSIFFQTFLLLFSVKKDSSSVLFF